MNCTVSVRSLTTDISFNAISEDEIQFFLFPEHIYCTETRPYNQGARLTAYELVHDKLPATLVLDSMVAALLRSRNIAAVVVGADRVAANGDTANKIGTYQIAVIARHHNVPFYIAAPLTSIDLTIASGDHIIIEKRPDREMTHVGEHRIAAPGNDTKSEIGNGFD